MAVRPDRLRTDGPRPAARRAPRRILNLALQGGGAHGAFTWGVLDRLFADDSCSPEGISGASAGAVNAVVFAAGWLDGGAAGGRAALARFWRRVADSSPANALGSLVDLGPLSGLRPARSPFDWTGSTAALELMTRLASPYQLNPFDFNPLRDILTDLVDFERLRRAAAPRLFIAATNLRSGECRIFTNEELTAAVVLASTSMPSLHHAVEIDGEPYWDGGLTANPPLLPLVEHCRAPDLLVVQINPAGGNRVPRTAPSISRRLQQILFNTPLASEVRLLHTGIRLANEGIAFGSPMRRRLRRLRLHAIDAGAALGEFGAASQLYPQWHELCELRDLGHAAAEDWLANGGGGMRAAVMRAEGD